MRCRQGVLDTDSGSGSGEMDAGLQMDTVALVLLELGVMAVPGGGGGGLYGPLVLPLASLALGSLTGEDFFLGGLGLVWPLVCCCCC